MNAHILTLKAYFNYKLRASQLRLLVTMVRACSCVIAVVGQWAIDPHSTTK